MVGDSLNGLNRGLFFALGVFMFFCLFFRFHHWCQDSVLLIVSSLQSGRFGI